MQAKERDMAGTARHDGARIDKILRVAFWGAAALLLLGALAAAQLAPGGGWSGGDFVFAAVALGLCGISFEATMRATSNWAGRFAAGFAVAAGVVIVVGNGAVGMIGDEGNPYNLYFLSAIAVAVLGAAVARVRASGMALAMLAAGIVHAGVALGGWTADPKGAGLSLGLAGLWLVSAALFRKAARDQGRIAG
jgi:hypothetical protein